MYFIYIYIYICCPHKFTSSSSPRPWPSFLACRFLQGIRQVLHDASAVAPQGRHVLPRLRFGPQAEEPEGPPAGQPLELGMRVEKMEFTNNPDCLNFELSRNESIWINIQICIQSVKFGMFISGFVGRFVGGSWPTSSWGRWSREPSIRKRRGAHVGVEADWTKGWSVLDLWVRPKNRAAPKPLDLRNTANRRLLVDLEVQQFNILTMHPEKSLASSSIRATQSAWTGCVELRQRTWERATPDSPKIQYQRQSRFHLTLSQSKNLKSLAMSYHFGYARAYAMLTRMGFFLTRNKFRTPLREVLTRSYASEGFAYAKRVMTRPLLNMWREVFRAAWTIINQTPSSLGPTWTVYDPWI